MSRDIPIMLCAAYGKGYCYILIIFTWILCHIITIHIVYDKKHQSHREFYSPIYFPITSLYFTTTWSLSRNDVTSHLDRWNRGYRRACRNWNHFRSCWNPPSCVCRTHKSDLRCMSEKRAIIQSWLVISPPRCACAKGFIFGTYKFHVWLMHVSCISHCLFISYLSTVFSLVYACYHV